MESRRTGDRRICAHVRELLGRLGGEREPFQRATVPFAVNGVVDTGNQAWSVYVNNVYEKGRTAPWGATVWLVLDAAHIVKNGSVSVDLSTALDAVGALLQNNYGWSNFGSNYWL